MMPNIDRISGPELPTFEIEFPDEASCVRGRRGSSSEDSMKSSLETSSSDKSSCCFLSCLNFVKDGILSFFNWVCSGFSSPATQEEISAVGSFVLKSLEELQSRIKTRYTDDKLNYSKDLAPCILADGFKIMSKFCIVLTIGELRFKKRVEDKNNPIRVRELESFKNEMLSSFNNLGELVDLEKNPIETNNSPEIQQLVEDFSLEKLPHFKSDESIKISIEMLFEFFDEHVKENTFNDIVELVNDIRIKNEMDPIKNN
jgi:hypothetical protein